MRKPERGWVLSVISHSRMPLLFFVTALLLINVSPAQARDFDFVFVAGPGAGFANTAGGIDSYDNGPGIQLSLGMGFKFVQARLSAYTFGYFGEKKNETAVHKNSAIASLGTIDLVLSPIRFVNFVVGYGGGSYAQSLDYVANGATVEQTQTFSGSALVAGAEAYPYHNGKMGVGLSYRYFQIASNNYDNKTVTQGVTTSYAVDRKMFTYGHLIYGVMEFFF